MITLHQIWLGPNPCPSMWTDSVKQFAANKNFHYILWKDNSTIQLKNLDQFEKCPDYAGKADILRYEILQQYGGVYIDADSVILNEDKLSLLIHQFFSSDAEAAFGIEPVIRKHVVANGVIFAKKNSGFIAALIQEISKIQWFLTASYILTGPTLVTEKLREMPSANVYLYASEVFYPQHWFGIKTVDAHKTMSFHDNNTMFQYGYSTNKLQHEVYKVLRQKSSSS